MKRALTALAIALLLALNAGAAGAEKPRNVHDGTAGVVEREWVRVACATLDSNVKCALRFPVDFSTVDFRLYSGGESVGTERFLARGKRWERLHGGVAAPVRMSGRLVPGVRAACSAKGSRAMCELWIPRDHRINMDIYVAGLSQGGLIWRP